MRNSLRTTGTGIAENERHLREAPRVREICLRILSLADARVGMNMFRRRTQYSKAAQRITEKTVFRLGVRFSNDVMILISQPKKL